MNHSADTPRELRPIAKSTLETFAKISATASAQLSEASPLSANTLAIVNTLTDLNALETIDRINDEKMANLRHLVREPAIARVVADTDFGESRVYFICRKTSVDLPGSEAKLASYRSPVGRLASLHVGESTELPNGKLLEVVERAVLHPFQSEQGWDSLDSVLYGATYGPLTVKSFLNLLAEGSILDSLLLEEFESMTVVQGIRRTMLTRIQLRDQPIHWISIKIAFSDYRSTVA